MKPGRRDLWISGVALLLLLSWDASGLDLVLVQLFSFYQRYRYGASAVVPMGLVLSLVAVGIMAFTGWKGGEMVFRHRVAVLEPEEPASQPSATTPRRVA